MAKAGGVAPKGFPVAVVTKVTPDVNGLSLRVDAKSHIEFRSLEEVFVVTDATPWDKAIIYDQQDSTLVSESTSSTTLTFFSSKYE